MSLNLTFPLLPDQIAAEMVHKANNEFETASKAIRKVICVVVVFIGSI
jgi:hypothetical protein